MQLGLIVDLRHKCVNELGGRLVDVLPEEHDFGAELTGGGDCVFDVGLLGFRGVLWS